MRLILAFLLVGCSSPVEVTVEEPETGSEKVSQDAETNTPPVQEKTTQGDPVTPKPMYLWDGEGKRIGKLGDLTTDRRFNLTMDSGHRFIVGLDSPHLEYGENPDLHLLSGEPLSTACVKNEAGDLMDLKRDTPYYLSKDVKDYPVLLKDKGFLVNTVEELVDVDSLTMVYLGQGSWVCNSLPSEGAITQKRVRLDPLPFTYPLALPLKVGGETSP